MASVEIVDLIQQNLEQEGVLARIRDELLSAVVNVLNLKESTKSKKSLDEFVGTANGYLALQIVLDLLETLELRKSRGTILAEIGGNFLALNRSELKPKVNLNFVAGQPILVTILDELKSKSGKVGSPKEKTSPVSKSMKDSKQSKRHHAEDTLTLDSDLEESIDATGSVGSVGSSSLTSLGSGRHKGLAPLAPLHVGVKATPTPTFPPTSSKQLAPISNLSLGASSKRSLEDIGSFSGSRSFGHEDKLYSSGSLLEQSTESVEEIKNDDSYQEDGDAALSPYVGGTRDKENQVLEGSGTIESSFEASSYMEQEESKRRDILSPTESQMESPTSERASGPSKRNIKSIEVGGRDFDADSDEDEDTHLKEQRGAVKASVSSASVTRSKAGWDVVEDDTVDYEMRATSPESFDLKPASSPAEPEDYLRGDVESSFEYDHDQDDSAVRESRADSVDTVSRLRQPREAFGSSREVKNDLPPLNKGNRTKTMGSSSSKNDWELALSPNEDSEAFPEDDDIYEDVEEDLDEDTALNMSRRSNQEEDEEEQKVMKRIMSSSEATGSKKTSQDDSMDMKAESEEDDYDDYGDDFEEGVDEDEDGRNEEVQPVPKPTTISAESSSRPTVNRVYDRQSDDESAASIESIEELEEDISVGMASSEEDEDEPRGGMTKSASGMLPKGGVPAGTTSSNTQPTSLFRSGSGRSATAPAAASNMRDFDDNSSDDDLHGASAPETGSATSEDIDQLDFSVGGGDSESESFLNEDDEPSGRRGNKGGESTEFSASENEISGSHGLDGFDYTTNAAPPRKNGW